MYYKFFWKQENPPPQAGTPSLGWTDFSPLVQCTGLQWSQLARKPRYSKCHKCIVAVEGLLATFLRKLQKLETLDTGFEVVLASNNIKSKVYLSCIWQPVLKENAKHKNHFIKTKILLKSVICICNIRKTS